MQSKRQPKSGIPGWLLLLVASILFIAVTLLLTILLSTLPGTLCGSDEHFVANCYARAREAKAQQSSTRAGAAA